MNKGITVLIAVLGLGMSSFQGLPSPYTPNQGDDGISKGFPQNFCKLKGAVYIEEVANFANYRVFVEEVEAFAQLNVFKEEAETFATEAGYWYFTDVRGFADFTIYIEDVKGFADFTIAYTEYRSSAGCN